MVLARERREQVEILRIDRPEARNAINRAVSEAIDAALDEAEADPAVRAVVLTGTGPVFSAGADLKELARGAGQGIFTPHGGFAGFVERDFSKPLIAAVNGTAVAGGFELVLACDLVVAADTAVFGLSEAKRGLVATGGGLVRLAKRVPLALALEIAMTGETIGVERAYAVGLVNRVVAAAQVVDAAVALARTITANSPLAVRNSRRLVREAHDLDEPAAWQRGRELAAEVLASPDALEGARAFTEKRAPVWQTT